jgi:DNA-binding transcriptional LysR family regulator
LDKSLFASLEDLAVFVAVVQEGSFSAAALRLGIAGSAISKRMARLETRIGSQLLLRTTRRLSLTEVGQLAYAKAREADSLLAEALSLAAERSRHPRGMLRVSASVSFGLNRVVPLLPGFRCQFPEVDVDLLLLDRMVDLVEEGVDVAIRIAERLPESSIARPLCPVRYRLCASPDYLRDHPIAAPADLLSLTCLHYRVAPQAGRWHLQKGSEAVDLAVQTPVVVNNSDAVSLLAQQGMGVALLADYACERGLQNGDLVAVLPDWDISGPFGGWAHAIWRPQVSLPRKTRVFIDFLAAEMGSLTVGASGARQGPSGADQRPDR